MAGPRVLVLLYLLVQPALAGVQVGRCYCNVGVCYNAGTREPCRTDEDFYGEGGSKESWCQAHPEDRICKPKEL